MGNYNRQLLIDISYLRRRKSNVVNCCSRYQDCRHLLVCLFRTNMPQQHGTCGSFQVLICRKKSCSKLQSRLVDNPAANAIYFRFNVQLIKVHTGMGIVSPFLPSRGSVFVKAGIESLKSFQQEKHHKCSKLRALKAGEIDLTQEFRNS